MSVHRSRKVRVSVLKKSTKDKINSLSWINEDVCYILMDINKNVAKDEMVAMAKDMID